jgi:hypothetical protein
MSFGIKKKQKKFVIKVIIIKYATATATVNPYVEYNRDRELGLLRASRGLLTPFYDNRRDEIRARVSGYLS